MASLNTKERTASTFGFTHEGAPAARISKLQELRRSIMSCFLWEQEFYEDGEDIATRIVRLAKELPPHEVAWLAVEARDNAHLRHVPLLLLSVIAQTGKGHKEVANLIERVVKRADELTEFLAIHAKRNGVELRQPNNRLHPGFKRTLSAQMKKGLARAFCKFDEYQLGKYDREGAVRLRDVLFLVHAKPENKAQARLWERLVKGELKVPDTWEVALSVGEETKKDAWERLLREGRLGYMALLRNLRNMAKVGCDMGLVKEAILARKGAKDVLPFRYTAAARAVPQLEGVLDSALLASIAELPALSDKTVVMVDVSSSMNQKLSGKSDLTRMDAAATLASIINADLRQFTFSNQLVEVPARRGMAGVDVVINSQPHGGTELIGAIAEVNKRVEYDRIIVISDEQAASDRQRLPNPKGIGYMINVASAQRGVGYGKWLHIDGFSEAVLRFIEAYEA